MKRREATKAVADILSINERVEVIHLMKTTGTQTLPQYSNVISIGSTFL
jgi:hypothetical protein